MVSTWQTLFWLTPLLFIVAGGILVSFLLRKRTLSIWQTTFWWKQLLFIVAGGTAVFFLGTLLVSPTGPGSSRIIFALLAAYALLLLLLGPKFTKVTGLILLFVFLATFTICTRNRNRYGQKLKARVEKMRSQDGKPEGVHGGEMAFDTNSVPSPDEARRALIALVKSLPTDGPAALTLPALEREQPKSVGNRRFTLGRWEYDLGRKRFSLVVHAGPMFEVCEGKFIRDNSGAWKALMTRRLQN